MELFSKIVNGFQWIALFTNFSKLAICTVKEMATFYMKRNVGLNWVKVARLPYFYNNVNITWFSVFNFKVVPVEDLVNKLVLISYSQSVVLNYLFT